MSRVLLSAAFLEYGFESCQLRVESRSACDCVPEAEALVARGVAWSIPGYFLSVSRFPRGGYDGKPLLHVEVTLLRFLSSEEQQDMAGRDGNLSWGQRDAL